MNFNELITKRSDAEKNDGLSGIKNWAAQQHHDTYEVFYNFIKEVKPKRILEIGTALGGLTQFLNWVGREVDPNFEILTYDIYEMNWYKEMRDSGIDVRVQNIFSSNYDIINEYPIDFIKKDGITIILCDGGNKVEEFRALSDFMKVGDFILAHDYGDNRQHFDENMKNKIWNWCEICDDDIKNSCEKNNLQQYNREYFEKVVWTCRVKI